jgi:hypothetical protein
VHSTANPRVLLASNAVASRIGEGGAHDVVAVLDQGAA